MPKQTDTHKSKAQLAAENKAKTNIAPVMARWNDACAEDVAGALDALAAALRATLVRSQLGTPLLGDSHGDNLSGNTGSHQSGRAGSG